MRTLSLFAFVALFLSTRALIQDPYYAGFIEKLGVEAHTTSEGKDCIGPIASAIYDFRDTLMYHTREVDTLVNSAVDLIDKLKYEVSPQCRTYYGDFGGFMVQYFGDFEDLRETALHNLETFLFEIDAAIRDGSLSLEAGRDDLAGEAHAIILRTFLGLEKAKVPAVPVDVKQLEQEIVDVITHAAEKIENIIHSADPYAIVEELYDDSEPIQEVIREGLQVASEILAEIQDEIIDADYVDVDQNDYIGDADDFAAIPHVETVTETQPPHEEIPVSDEPPSFDTQVDYDHDTYGYEIVEPEVPTTIEEPEQVESQDTELPYEASDAPETQEQDEAVDEENDDAIEENYAEEPSSVDTQTDYDADEIYGDEIIEQHEVPAQIEEPAQVESQDADLPNETSDAPAAQDEGEVVIYTTDDVVESDYSSLDVDQNDYIGYADEFADIPNLESVNKTQNTNEVPVEEPPRFDTQIDYDADEIYGDAIIGQHEVPRIEEPAVIASTIPEHVPELPKEVELQPETYEEPRGPGIRRRLLMEVPSSLDSRHGATTNRFARTDICFNSVLDRFTL